jgi:hypothetical protein
VEGIGDQIGEAFGEGRWLTYSELAQIRGIGRESAVKLVQRERWRRLPGNDRDRTVRVFVPADWLKSAKGGQIGEAIPEGFGELSRLVTSFHDTIAFVRERAEAAEARADQAEADRRAADARADAERGRADRADAAIAGERARADTLRQRVDELQAGQQLMTDTHARALAAAQDQLERVREAAAHLRQADVERRARGLIARLRAAWRGE